MSEWISVEDRLPKGVDDVLVYYNFGYITSRAAHHIADGVDGIGGHVYHVTHWMPLPEPPVTTDGESQ